MLNSKLTMNFILFMKRELTNTKKIFIIILVNKLQKVTFINFFISFKTAEVEAICWKRK